MPVLRDGRVLGVVEVYVDQTARAGRSAPVASCRWRCVVALRCSALLAGDRRWQWMRRAATRSARSRSACATSREHDVLSGALNRASFNEALQQAAWRHDGGRPGLRRAVRRPRSLQGSQRHAAAMPPATRCCARSSQRLRARAAPRRPAWRAWAATSSRSCSGAYRTPTTSRTLARRMVEALAEPFDVGGGQRDAAAASASAPRSAASTASTPRRSAAQGRPGAVPGEGRRGAARFSFYDAALDDQLQRAPRAGARAAPGDRQPSSSTLHYQPLYAGRWPHADRLRGAGALEAPDARPGAAGGFHPGGRGQRPDRRARRLGAARGLRARPRAGRRR